MATRGRDTQTIGEYSWVLESGDEAVQGEAAGLDTNTATVRPMGSSATQLFVGFFAETKTGDGTKKVRVALPDEIEAEWLDNDSGPNNVDASDLGSEVYAKDGRTVSTLGTDRSKAGRVLDYDATLNKVLVQGGSAVSGPTGASGIAGSVADRAALAAVGASSRATGMVVMVQSDRSTWMFDGTATSDEDEGQELVIEPAAGSGRWLRADKAFTMKLPIDYTMADGAAILTVPAGFVLRLTGLPFWEVTTGFSGGSSSAIGVASDKTGYDTAGDILGGATGDVAASLTAGVRAGTIGPKLDSFAELQAFFLEEADTLTFERITSAFTAGAGFVCLPVSVSVPD